MFSTTQNRGFQITFENGNTVSVQWGPGNYCDPTHEDGRGAAYDAPAKADRWSSTTAEVAAWDKNSVWHNFGHDNVSGWMTADEVLAVIQFVASSELDGSDPFKWSDEE